MGSRAWRSKEKLDVSLNGYESLQKMCQNMLTGRSEQVGSRAWGSKEKLDVSMNGNQWMGDEGTWGGAWGKVAGSRKLTCVDGD